MNKEKKSSKDSVRFKIPNKEKEDSVATITTYKSQDGVKPEEPKKSQKLEEWIKSLLLKPISACIPTPKHKENKGEKEKKKSETEATNQEKKPNEDVEKEEENPLDNEENKLQKEESVPNKLEDENKPIENEGNEPKKLEEENLPDKKLEEDKPPQNEGIRTLDVPKNELEEENVPNKKLEENKPVQNEGIEPKTLEDVPKNELEKENAHKSKLEEENKTPQNELDVEPNKLEEEKVPDKLEGENKPQNEGNEPKKLEEVPIIEGKQEKEALSKDMQKAESKDERESHLLSKFSDPFILNIVVEEPVREVSAKNFASKNVGTSFDKIEHANKKIGTSFDKMDKIDKSGNNGIKPGLIKLAPFRAKNVNLRHERHFNRVMKRRDFIERYYELDSENVVPLPNFPVYETQDDGEDGLKYKSLRQTIKFAIPLMYNIIKNLDSNEGTNTDPKCGAKDITSDEIFTYLETKTETFNKVADPLGYLETADQNEAGASKGNKK